MPEKPDGRLVSTWEMLYKDDEGEGHVVPLHKYDYTPDGEELFITQAPPIRITPSRAKPVERDFYRYASIPDEQIGYRNIGGELVPIHDERAMRVARLILKDARPDCIVSQGDTADLSEMSRFAPDSDHFIKTVQPTIDRVSSWRGEVAADHPDAKKVWLEGNHQRLTKFILKNTMQLYNIKRANSDEPVLTLDYLTRASEMGWDVLGGYPANEFRAEDDLVFVHGDRVRSGGSTADLMSKKYPERNVVFGHIHRQEKHTRTDYLGRYLTAISFGTLARIDGVVPSHGNGVDNNNQPVERYENWQQGIGFIDKFPDGTYVFHSVLISDGVGHWNGKEYNGNEVLKSEE